MASEVHSDAWNRLYEYPKSTNFIDRLSTEMELTKMAMPNLSFFTLSHREYFARGRSLAEVLSTPLLRSV